MDLQTLHPQVLVVEDDEHIRCGIRTSLQAEGWIVFEASTLKSGLSEAGTRRPDLIILDLVLPDGDGLQYLHDLRAWSAVPVIVLSGRNFESDKIAVLDAGADDCVTKPFSLQELAARARSSQRRWRSQLRNASSQFEQRVRIGAIEVDLTIRRVSRAGQLIALTPIEYRILVLLIQNLGKVLLHSQLLTTVWGPLHANDRQYLRVYIAGLRKKLELNPRAPRHLLTESSIGYRLMP